MSSQTSARAPSSTTLYRSGMFQSLAIRDFRYLWMGSVCASFAMQMQIVARGWLIYDMTSSPMALTWVMLSFMLPSFLFSLGGGVIADRARKKAIMIISQSLNTAATVLLAWIVVTDQVTFWHFIYFGLFNGTVLAISMPARSSVTPEIVGDENLVNAMALQSATFNLARILGPVLAGIVIAVFAAGDTSSTFGVGVVFFVISALYAISVLATTLLRYEGKPQRQVESTPMEDIREGFRYMRDEKVVLGLLIMGMVPMTFGYSASFLLPAFNQDIIGGGPDDLGYLMMGMGVGALGGSLMLARAGDFGGKGRVMFLASYAWAFAMFGFALSGSLVAALVTGAVVGLFSSVFGSLNMTVVQLAVRAEIRGRVMSIMMMTHGLMPLGTLPVSALAEYVGIEAALMFAAGMLLLSMILLGFWIPELRKIDKGHGSQVSTV